MQPFTAKYTDAQREAVVRAAVDEGFSGPKIVQAAAEGRLTDGPFVIPLSTVYWLARRERVKRHRDAYRDQMSDKSPGELLDLAVRKLIHVLLLETQHLHAAYQRNEPDPQRLRWLIRCDRELRKTLPDSSEYEGLSELDHLASGVVGSPAVL